MKEKQYIINRLLVEYNDTSLGDYRVHIKLDNGHTIGTIGNWLQKWLDNNGEVTGNTTYPVKITDFRVVVVEDE